MAGAVFEEAWPLAKGDYLQCDILPERLGVGGIGGVGQVENLLTWWPS
jgi:hypothetical protein